MPAPEPADGESEAIAGLRDAVRLAPGNIGIRQALGEALMGADDYAGAEKVFREALLLAPERITLKLGLARAFFLQDKHSHALALVESVTKRPDATSAVHLMHARLLAASGEPDAAAVQYRRAVELDPTSEDSELAELLGCTDDEDDLGLAAEKLPVSLPEGGAPTFEDSGVSVSDSSVAERSTLRFSDVGGLDGVKEEIRAKIIHPLAHAELYRAYGKSVGGGILMYGPPGCGKTHLARATAGEIEGGFLSVGISDVLEMWLGRSERNLHEIFEQARRRRPCVLFFDEVDALGGNRSDLRQQGGRNLVNQFLAEFDGVRASNDGVLVLAATNAPWHLDSAFRRPGRFDRVIFVPPPDATARREILRVLLSGKPVGEMDVDVVARKTEEYSGADLKALVDVAVEAKLREAIRAGRPKPITTRDLLGAIQSLRPTTREWFASARNHALYANQGGIYDEILQYLKIK